ncbi:copper chaperone PCu(A)C [Iodidimonas sp. SYSU 1G8]|uniref:copper chaperone PCu(A)C n=1 Tax=Iodidimonas sp. SYSU 1G8 TaxID=3133967 RepID=UPI0031FF377C
MFRTATVTLFLLACAVSTACARDYKAGSLTIQNPWSRATPDGAKVGAGYLTIVNTGSEDRLLAATAPAVSDRVEVHEGGMRDGVMTMRHLPDGLLVPAEGTMTLKPGSFHIMFMDLKRPLKPGESFAGVLRFEKAGKVEVRFEVQPVGATAPASGHDAHDHSNMAH